MFYRIPPDIRRQSRDLIILASNCIPDRVMSRGTGSSGPLVNRKGQCSVINEH
jgi:hypothetical protein